jgi:hypothetical protein
VAQLRDWANRNARDKQNVAAVAAKQLAQRKILNEPDALAIVKALFPLAK